MELFASRLQYHRGRSVSCNEVCPGVHHFSPFFEQTLTSIGGSSLVLLDMGKRKLALGIGKFLILAPALEG